MTTHGTARFLSKPACALGISFFLLAGTLAAQPARAGQDASAFVADLGRQAITIMKDPAISRAERQHRFAALMEQDFDLPKISQFVLGNYWQTASAAERQEFTAAFGGYMTSVYSNRFAEYNAGSFRVTTQQPTGETTTVVNSEITRVSTGEPINLDWVVARTPGSYKVIDITAGGMSLSRAQREEFSSVVHRNGDSVANLTQQLQMKSTELAAAMR